MKASLLKHLIIPTLLATLGLAGTVSADINTGLQLYLPFNANFLNASAVSRAVTVNGNAALCDVNGVPGQACAFDGNGDYLRVTPAVAGTADFTTATWIYIPDLQQAAGAYYTPVQSASAGIYYDWWNEPSWGLGPHLSIFVFRSRNGTGAADAYALPASSLLGRWTHVAVVGFSDNTAKVYLDGVEQSTVKEYRSVSGLLDQTSVGAVYNGNTSTSYGFLNGMTDEVRLYSRALTAAEVQEVMVAVPPPNRDLWSYATGDEVNSSPALGLDGTVYIGAADGKFYAFAGGTSLQPLGQFDTGGPLYSSPTIGDDGTIFIPTFSSKSLLAFASGTSLNTPIASRPIGYSTWTCPTIGLDGALYFAGRNPGGHFLKLASSDPLTWNSAVLSNFEEGIYDLNGSPALGTNGLVYFTGSGSHQFSALRSSDWTKVWDFPMGEAGFSSPAIGADGTVYFGCGNGKFFALAGDTGALRWDFSPGQGQIYSSPVVSSDNTVYFATDSGTVYARDGQTGAERWRFVMAAGTSSSPLLAADGTLYMGGGRYLYALDAASGQEKWKFLAKGPVSQSAPVITPEGIIYFGTGRGDDNKGWVHAILANSAAGLADAPWPMFKQNAQHTGRQKGLLPSQPPVISVQPIGMAATVGATATVTVVATGTNPLSYQWRKDGANLTDGGNVSGATTATLTLANLQESDQGSYDVVVANSEGTAISTAAVLTVSEVDPLALGLMAYYPLNGNGQDASGLGHDAAPVGNPGWVADHLGNPASACQLNGSSDYFNLTAVPFDFSGDFSVAAWVRIPNPNLFNPIFGNWTRDIPGFAFTTYNGVLHFNGSNFGRSVTGARNVCDAGWRHVAAVRQAGEGRLYVDGVLDASASVGNGDVTHNSLNAMGQWGVPVEPGRYFAGSLDEVRLYNRALDVTEVATLAGVTPPNIGPRTTGYFCMYSRGLEIVDVTAPSSPVLLGTFSEASQAQRVVIENNRAFVTDGYSGFRLLDISDPANPRQLYHNPKFCYHVGGRGNYAYMCSGAYGLYILDISNVSEVREVAHFPTRDGLGGCQDIEFTAVNGRQLAVACDGRAGVMVVDVTNPDAASLVGYVSWPSARATYKIAVAGSHVYGCTSDGLGMADISNLDSPATWNKGVYGTDWLYDAKVVGNYAYLAADSKGMIVLDVSNPMQPQPVGQWTLPSGVPDNTYANKITVAGNRAYLGADAYGIVILDVSTPTQPLVVGGYAPAGGRGFGSAVQVEDDSNHAPTVTCPQPTLVECVGASGTMVQVQALVTDPDSGTLTVTLKEGGALLGAKTVASPVMDSLIQFDAYQFTPGAHSLVIEVSDGTAAASCQSTVTLVQDTEKPTITAPPAVTANTDAGKCEAGGIALGTPLTADNCGVASVGNNAPGVFPKGTTPVTWTVTDNAGNTATATQTVTVTDAENPTITAPVAVTVSTDAGQNYATAVALGDPVTADNCGVASVANNAPAQFLQGETTVTWTVADTSGNTATATQIVTVNDTEPPTIIAPPDVVVNTDPGASGSGTTLTPPVSTDNSGIASVTSNAPATFPVGTTIITWTVTDTSGNASTITQTVTVRDQEPPNVASAVIQPVTVSPGLCSASGVNLGEPIVSDNCGIASVVNDAPGVFPKGVTIVTWTVTDTSGNTAIATQTVTVIDAEKPTITAPAAIVVNADAGQNTASGVNLGTPTTADNCGIVSVANAAPPTFPIGMTTVTWTVQDESGNTATATQPVTVNDNEPPTITAPLAIATGTDPGLCEAANVTLGSATASDNSGAVTIANNAPSVFPKGVTVVTWTATDASGNTASATQTVTVNDSEPPTIACPNAIVRDTDPGQAYATVAIVPATATDNCGALVSGVRDDGQALDAPYPKGVTTITWTATDGVNPPVSCQQTVTVADHEPPVITCPSDITQDTNPGECQATVLVTAATATDNCGATVAGVRSDGLTLTDPYPKGVTLITWTATDEAGNTASCTQTITVEDRENPTITAPVDLLLVSDSGSGSASEVALGNPVTADNCEVINISSDHPSTTFPLGETVVTWTVTDSSGNTATAVQKVTVLPSVSVTFQSPLAGQPVANKIRLGQVVPHKVTLVDCFGATVTSGVTVKLKVQGIDSASGEVFQEVPEDANGVGSDGTVTSDGIMVLTAGKYQFNLDTGNFEDPNTLASPTRFYCSTVTVVDNATLMVLGTVAVNLETRK